MKKRLGHIMFIMLATILFTFSASHICQAEFPLPHVYVNWGSTGTPDGNSWTTGWKTIQEGIDDADVSDEQVWVKTGAYNENINLKRWRGPLRRV